MHLHSSMITMSSIGYKCVPVDRSQPKTIFQNAVEPEDNKDDDIEPAWKKKKV